MKNTKGAVGNCFLLICIFAVMFWNNTHGSMEDGNYSNQSLEVVPKKIPAKVTTLDLSNNNISELYISDFSSLSKLRRLIMSCNHVANLDLGVFKNNRDLEYLDFSQNNLKTIYFYSNMSLKHLNLSCNWFESVPPFHEHMPNLEVLSISMKRIQRADVTVLKQLRVDTLQLDLRNLSEYNSEYSLILGTRNLQILLPEIDKVSILSNIVLDGTKKLVLSKIQNHNVATFLSKLSKTGNLVNLTLNDLRTSWRNLNSIFQEVWKTSIQHFSICNISLSDFEQGVKVFKFGKTSLRTLTIKNVHLEFIRFEQRIVYETFANMNIEALTISDAGFIHMLCPFQPSPLTYLDFSGNVMTDMLFENCNKLPRLKSFILKDNHLKKLAKVSLMTSPMKSLKYLDMSRNLLQYEDNGNQCRWGENIAELNLSFNVLSNSVFRCLPINIQKLYLQNNGISRIPEEIIELNSLEELNVASNKLTVLSGCFHLKSLRVLNVEMNSILSVSHDFFQSCQSIQTLNGGSNPFDCSCELRQFINLEARSVQFVDWPDSYQCQYPENLKRTLLKDFHISEVVCNVALLITTVLIVTLVLVAAITFLCLRFDIPWYLKMMWRWTRVKHRIWKTKPQDMLDNLHFHAFVSYSEHDSDWVKNVLIQNLEKEDVSIRICQHERNFIAGKSIVENIIDCVEKSYKSIFILSPNFVQSEWCHYELYFAHHKLFGEKADHLILVLLDSIPAYTIPSKYHMLKSLMARKTYLEWPKEKSKQVLFWANLRAAIQIKLLNNEEMNELIPDIQDVCRV